MEGGDGQTMEAPSVVNFLSAFGTSRFTFQTFSDRNGASYPRILHGPYSSCEKRLRQLNALGAGIFWMVSAGDLQGRRAQNVVRISAYFADLDGAPLFDEYPLLPTAIVESSPARYHLYWRVTDAPLEQFGHVQKHVAALLGGDDKVHDLPRVMRLPGYLHAKGEPFRSRTLELNPQAVYRHSAFTSAFGIPEWTAPRVLPPLPAVVQDYCDMVAGAKGGGGRHKLLDRVATAGSGARNDTLFRNAAALANDVKAGQLDADTMRAELVEAARITGLDEREIERTITSALRYG